MPSKGIALGRGIELFDPGRRRRTWSVLRCRALRREQIKASPMADFVDWMVLPCPLRNSHKVRAASLLTDQTHCLFWPCCLNRAFDVQTGALSKLKVPSSPAKGHCCRRLDMSPTFSSPLFFLLSYLGLISLYKVIRKPSSLVPLSLSFRDGRAGFVNRSHCLIGLVPGAKSYKTSAVLSVSPLLFPAVGR